MALFTVGWISARIDRADIPSGYLGLNETASQEFVLSQYNWVRDVELLALDLDFVLYEVHVNVLLQLVDASDVPPQEDVPRRKIVLGGQCLCYL